MGLKLPGGAVKVLTPCSLDALILGKGLVTGIATCSLLVWDDGPTVPKDPYSYHDRCSYTMRGMAKQNKHTAVVHSRPQFVDCHPEFQPGFQPLCKTIYIVSTKRDVFSVSILMKPII